MPVIRKKLLLRSRPSSDTLAVYSVEIHRPPNNFFDAVLIGELGEAYEKLDANQVFVGAGLEPGLRLDRQGIHKPGLFAKFVAWPDVVGTEIKYSYLRVLGRKNGKTGKVMEIPRSGWNRVLLDRVIRCFAPQATRT